MLDLYLQWLTDPAAGWEKHAVGDWDGLPKSDDGSDIDGDKGTLACIFIAGQGCIQDHISVEEKGDKIIMSGWSVNAMFGTGLPLAKVWTLGEEIVTTVREYDPKPGTHHKETTISLHQELTVYVDEQHWHPRPLYCNPGQVIFLPYEDFVPPPESVTRHSAVVSDELWAAHQAFKNTSP